MLIHGLATTSHAPRKNDGPARGHKDHSRSPRQFTGRASFVFRGKTVTRSGCPCDCESPASDPWLDSFAVSDPAGLHIGHLLTSPETYLKRLLSKYQCPVHAIGKAYRANEEGSEHAIEFTMLEWYRPTPIHPFQAMVSEIQDLVETLTEYGRPEVIAYSDVFEATYGLNPHQATTDDLAGFSSNILGPKVRFSRS